MRRWIERQAVEQIFARDFGRLTDGLAYLIIAPYILRQAIRQALGRALYIQNYRENPTSKFNGSLGVWQILGSQVGFTAGPHCRRRN